MIKFIKNLGFKFSMLYNRKLLLRIANMPADGTVALTKDEEKLLTKMVKYIQPSQVVTRNGKAVFRFKSIEEIGLWDILETRRAETPIGRIEAWTNFNYSPTTIADAAKSKLQGGDPIAKFLGDCIYDDGITLDDNTRVIAWFDN